jgi:hypothetical protein
MKTRFIYILLAGLLLSNSWATAQKTSFKERSEQWLQQSNNSSDESGGDGWINPGDTEEPENPTMQRAPVGDFLPLLVGLGLIYGVYIFVKKKKRV